MSVFRYVILLVVVVPLFIAAQEPFPVSPGVYVSPEKKLYVNKNLGIYVWLSVSPDENSEKVRLMSDSSVRYSNPMYFDTEGYNTFRSPSAVDTISHNTVYPQQDIIFEVYSDGLAPRTRPKLSRATTFTSAGQTFYGKGLLAELTASDAMSGIAATYCSINGSGFTEYHDSVNIPTEGDVSLRYYSTDRVGNREDIQTLQFTTDFSGPLLRFETEGNGTVQNGAGGSRLKLLAEDKLSGVKAVYYRIGNAKPLVYSKPIPVKQFENTQSSLVFWAVDRVGNTSAEMQVSYNQLKPDQKTSE